VEGERELGEEGGGMGEGVCNWRELGEECRVGVLAGWKD